MRRGGTPAKRARPGGTGHSNLYILLFMGTESLLREARKAAALTQRELADRVETAQSAVAAYESGARVPTLATLRRLLDACDYDLSLVARPRIRPSASPLCARAPQITPDSTARYGGDPAPL